MRRRVFAAAFHGFLVAVLLIGSISDWLRGAHAWAAFGVVALLFNAATVWRIWYEAGR